MNAVRFDHPTYISLDVPEPMAAAVRNLRRVFDPEFAHLPVEIAVAGSSGLGVLARENNSADVCRAIDRIAGAVLPIATRFTAGSWLGRMRVYALEVDRAPSLQQLNEALARSGLSFDHDVPAEFLPHCTLRWSDRWMNQDQAQAWRVLSVPREEFVLRTLSLYSLAPHSGRATLLYRWDLGL